MYIGRKERGFLTLLKAKFSFEICHIFVKRYKRDLLTDIEK